MKFSLDWLRAYVDLPETADRVAELLAEAGLPVDALERWGADTTLDVDVLANRPDCMCHLGLARELAARTGRALRLPPADPPRDAQQATELAAVEIMDEDLCSRYTALVLTGVKVAPSPDWLQDRLASIGLRPINNLVDATNFVLHETGQPLHAFDLDRLQDARVIIRRAQAGEQLKTLDGENRVLDGDDLLITDSKQALALAGIMGGADSEISDSTTRVLIESAHFAASAIRRTSRRLGMHTDASHRFERGADPGMTMAAALRTAQVMLESCGGSLAAGAVDVQAAAPAPAVLTLSLQRVQRLLGMPISAEQAEACLTPLGFTVSAGDTSMSMTVTVPTWRVDVTDEVDLIEEVGRMHGYDQVPATIPLFTSTTAGRPRPMAGPDRARSYLAAAGFSESISFPMASRAQQEAFAFPLSQAGDLVSLDNPLNRQMGILRASLIPGLLNSIACNRNRGREDASIFEIGRIYREPASSGDKTAGPLPLPMERTLVSAVTTGRGRPPHWLESSPALDFFDMKGVLEGAMERATGKGIQLLRMAAADRPAFLAEESAAWVHADQGCMGWLGHLVPASTEEWDLTGDILAFEVDVTDAPPDLPVTPYVPLPRHPSADRDLAIILPEEVTYRQLAELLRQCGGELLESVSLFDRYAGKPVPPGSVSLAVRLVFRAPDRTLTAAPVQALITTMMERIRKELGGDIRDAKS